MKLLVTARDIGATVNIIEIAKEAIIDKEIDIYVYTQNPASKYFYNAGINNINEINLPAVTDKNSGDTRKLLSFAEHLIDEIRPDAVLSGLSSPRDAGIDEAIVAVCDEKIKTFVMQDFWGEVNTFFDKTADYYFCLDQEAAKLTKDHFNTEAIAIGSPRHASYANLKISDLRQQIRNKLQISQDRNLIGLFSQSLHFLPGYFDTIKQMLSSVKNNNPETALLYRKHPRETDKEANAIIDLINSMGLDLFILDENRVEFSLLACDMVCSIFSNCIYDSCYLNYFANSPLIVPVILSYHSDVIQYAKQFNVYDFSPYQKQQLAFICDKEDSFLKNFNYLLSTNCKEQYWQRAKQVLENPVNSAKKALSIIKETI
ncbi:TPA: hypothetical protein JBA10_16065 [Legionella pneumophila]|uniref:hypothetical protein n=1 Tax=Legionella pneumophila TaxID=446 RepID=UPI0004894F3E|nr:hypothetical protein [Legionella pneumophila]STX73238.1 Uncharacterised protein [Legionella pneumophila]HAT2064642.1 hypothetical protein [Legionella pneumophila]HAT2067238.1 hypothetical protein [Legionella pneumophila]HAT8594050.1 hypothetical protein [Legionella pneumophila]HAT8696834.1 hypothetical protein [Legionella pneumophila]